MSSDALWDSIRSGMISLGTLMVPLGWFDIASIEPFVNNVMIIGGAIIAVGTFIWMLKVKWGTRAVPAIIAEQPHIPVVSPITGVVQSIDDLTKVRSK